MRSRLSLVVFFLIGLAFLVGAETLKGQAPKNETAQPRGSGTPTGKHNAPAKPNPSSIVQISGVVASPTGTPESNYQRYYPKDSAELAAWLQAVATVLLVGFAAWQMGLLRRSTHATEAAADAARDNAVAAKKAGDISRENVEISRQLAEANRRAAEAAQLALQTDRPYLLVETAKLEGVIVDKIESIKSLADVLGQLLPEDRFNPCVTFNFRNYGKGPALLESAHTSMEALEGESVLPPVGDFSKCYPIELGVDAIGPNQRWSVRTPLAFQVGLAEQYLAIQAGYKQIITYGCVRYRDVFKQRIYETGFCWVFYTPQKMVLPGLPGFIWWSEFVRGEKARNYNT